MSTRILCAPTDRRGFLRVLKAGALCGAAFAALGGTGHAAASPEAFVTDVSNSVLSIVNSSAGTSEKQQRFRALVEHYADVPAISIFSLGQYAKALPDTRKAEYYGLMQDYLARLFLTHIETFRGDKVEIVNTKVRSEKDIVVSTLLHYTDGRKLAINWRLVKRGEAYKIFDTSIEGVWLAVQQRSSFVSTISQQNGDVTALLEFLKKSKAS